MPITVRPVIASDWPAVTAIFNHFTECGRFRRVGTKHGRDFDMVWMQFTP